MNKKIFELTLAVYRVTDLFRREEPIRQQIREKANEILAQVLEADASSKKVDSCVLLVAKIQAVRSLLGVARFSNLVKPVNVLVLDREYDFFVNYYERHIEYTYKDEHISTELVQTSTRTSEKMPAHFNGAKINSRIDHEQFVSSHKEKNAINSYGGSASDGHKMSDFLNERQKTILDYIRTNQQVKSADLSGLFSDKFSIKTLQRDLASMIDRDIIERDGDKRWAVYRAKV